jgi:hypothetical protein
MKVSEIQINKPAAKTKASSRPFNGQPQSQSQTRGRPSYEQVAACAYQLYVDSGWQEGRDLENWLRAEQLLRERGASDAALPGARTDGKPERGNETRARQ